MSDLFGEIFPLFPMHEAVEVEAAIPPVTIEEVKAKLEEVLPVETEPPLHLQFTEVRKELLKMEKTKAAGGEVDINRVQELVRKAADLMARIQTSTTGPKKKIVDGEVKEAKAKRTPKTKKPSSIAHLAIPDGDDF